MEIYIIIVIAFFIFKQVEFIFLKKKLENNQLIEEAMNGLKKSYENKDLEPLLKYPKNKHYGK